jgi:hypothetical protein
LETIKRLLALFNKNKSTSSPLIIIKRALDDSKKEYSSIEKAIAELESDPNVPKEQIQKLKSSIIKLKNQGSIEIKNGEIQR